MILLLSFNSFTKIVKGERRKNQARLNFLFRTASYLRSLLQRYSQTSEIISSLLGYFTASAVYLRGLPQRYSQTSEKHEVYFDVFHSECRVSSQFTAKIVKGERRKNQVHLFFYSEPHPIFAGTAKILTNEPKFVQTSE